MPGEDIVVFEITSNNSKCSECGEELWRGRMLRKEGEKGLCLDCADLGHLLFLGAGDACLTRRARKYSPIAVVVLRWSRARKRYERQGLLVTGEAMDRAEEECLDDVEVRERRQLSAAMRRNQLDAGYIRRFAEETRKRFPAAPDGVETRIAEHACEKHSGRIGRTAAAVLALSKAFALAMPEDEALAIRDDVGYFQAVRPALVKTEKSTHKPQETLDAAIRQIVSRAIVSDRVIDIFEAAGLKKPDISILSDGFLGEIRDLPQRKPSPSSCSRSCSTTRSRRNRARTSSRRDSSRRSSRNGSANTRTAP